MSIFTKPFFVVVLVAGLAAGGAWAGWCAFGTCGASSSVAEADRADVVLTSSVATDASDKDCDRPCSKSAVKATTVATAPADAADSDCHKGKATTVAHAEAAPADVKDKDCDRPCPKKAADEGTTVASAD